MSKWLWTIIFIGLVVLLAGCSVSATEAEQATQVTPVSSTEGQAGGNTPAAAVSALTVRDVQRITPADARALVEDGKAVLIDARSAKAYSSRHAAGAISLPEEEVAARADELPTDKSVIFY
jgi:hypothetical protein